jgi:hypothetical protein
LIVSDDLLKIILRGTTSLALIFGILGATSGFIAGWAGIVLSSRSDRQIATTSLAAGKANERAGVADEAAAKANERAGKAYSDAANANERAAKLEKEAAELHFQIEQTRVPLLERRLTEDQIDTLRADIKDSGIRVALVSPGSDRETDAYAEDFRNAFDGPGILENISVKSVLLQGGVNAVPEGVNFTGPDSPEKSRLESIFKKAKIPFGNEGFGRKGMPLGRSVIGGPGIVEISIGARKNLRP